MRFQNWSSSLSFPSWNGQSLGDEIEERLAPLDPLLSFFPTAASFEVVIAAAPGVLWGWLSEPQTAKALHRRAPALSRAPHTQWRQQAIRRRLRFRDDPSQAGNGGAERVFRLPVWRWVCGCGWMGAWPGGGADMWTGVTVWTCSWINRFYPFYSFIHRLLSGSSLLAMLPWS